VWGPPGDLYGQYDLKAPQPTVMTGLGTGNIVLSDPTRCLFVVSISTAAANLFLWPTTTTLAANVGILLTSTSAQNPFICDLARYGPFCGAQWGYNLSAAAWISVMELLIRRPPANLEQLRADMQTLRGMANGGP
jgi:hypothetical protein